MEHGTHRPRPLIYGEVLFDCFPDGQEVMGGAPFNVAWHLQGFGAAPLFISRVGDDAQGAQVRDAMRSWHMDERGMQQDPDHPTGRVEIGLSGTGHSFSILPDQAYDYIATGDALAAQAALGAPPALLYYGSLIARGPVSRATLAALRAADRAPSFVDINLRTPWWAAEQVEALLPEAHWLKLNDEELSSLRGPTNSVAAAEAQAEQLRTESGIAWVILTRGAAGASVIGDTLHRGQPPKIDHLVDSIGAGDAFSAVTILGLLHDWPMDVTLERALGFAARICEQRGATAPDHALYTKLRRDWQL